MRQVVDFAKVSSRDRNLLLFLPDAIGTLREATATATQAGNVAAALTNLAVEGNKRSSAADFAAVACPAVCRVNIAVSLAQVRQMLVAGFQAHR